MAKSSEAITSSDALFTYAYDLGNFIDNLQNSRDSILKAVRQVSTDWRDDGFKRFSDAVDDGMKKLNIQLDELLAIVNKIVRAANKAYEIEQKQNF